jgi:hypothetical protein
MTVLEDAAPSRSVCWTELRCRKLLYRYTAFYKRCVGMQILKIIEVDSMLHLPEAIFIRPRTVFKNKDVSIR